jgi:DNA-directed RNA polymerase specialized sigma24 family protein
MTQNNTQSVRIEAETATTATTCRIPTFEEVYEMPYVQESLRSLIALTVQKFPVLANYQDDLRQESLLHLYNDLPRYNGRSDIKTFARLSIESGLKTYRNRLLKQKNTTILYAVDIDSVPENDESLVARDSIRSDIDTKELEEILQSINDPVLRKAVDMIASGDSILCVAKKLNIPYASLYRSLASIKDYLKKNFV